MDIPLPSMVKAMIFVRRSTATVEVTIMRKRGSGSFFMV